jgi:hypothetical protein
MPGEELAVAFQQRRQIARTREVGYGRWLPPVNAIVVRRKRLKQHLFTKLHATLSADLASPRELGGLAGHYYTTALG